MKDIDKVKFKEGIDKYKFLADFESVINLCTLKFLGNEEIFVPLILNTFALISVFNFSILLFSIFNESVILF